MTSAIHWRNGNIALGRIMVIVVCLLVLWVDTAIFKQASAPAYPLPALKGAVAVSVLWLLTGAAGTCLRRGWARPMMLTVLYLGSIGSFVWAIIVLGVADRTLAGGFKPTFFAGVVYLIASLVLTNSKHVRRLTSRMFE
jgi:hypothetical protein